MKTFKGHILLQRIFDVGGEIDLPRAAELLAGTGLAEQFKLRRSSRNIIIDQAPLSVSLGEWEHEHAGKVFSIQTLGKLWSFGAFSLTFKIAITQETSLSEMKRFAHYLENEDEITALALEQAERVSVDLAPAIKQPGIWNQFEDYIIFMRDPEDAPTPEELLSSESFFQLLLTETDVQLSNQMKDSIRANFFQYSKDDYVVIDWNAAFICASPADAQDMADVAEFALCQVLEMRYYDEMLDRKLGTLYKSIQVSKPSIFSNNYSQHAHDAALIYIEISEVIEKIENTLKVIGDFYYAKIFRAASDRFRVKDWQASVDQKLKNLADVSSLFQAETNEKRNQLMEAIIIILIAIEVIPFLWTGFSQHFLK
ncbi:MAG: hypothetical protein CME71_10110 [Halobacteriovorax sp.]|mgnify:CR=1 FL=1|nr:hypothetical protein [Halobacteriovorax sp.]